MKTLLFILSFTFIFSLSAATSNKEKPAQPVQNTQEEAPPKFDVRTYGDEVNLQMNLLEAKLKKGNITGIDLVAYSKTFEEYSKYPEIEKATKIYRHFFENSAKYLKGMSLCKITMESLDAHKMLDDPRYIEAKKLYDPAIKNFLKFFEDPPHIKKTK